MTDPSTRAKAGITRRLSNALAAFLVVQTLAAVFFVGDVIGDLIEDPGSIHFMSEALVTAVLVLGVIFGAVALRRTLEQMRAQETALQAASGALAQVIDRQFADWGLTPA